MSLFIPNYIFEKTENITAEFLQERGINTIALDVDNTLTTHGNMEVTPSMSTWLNEMQNAGINLMIVSNNKFERVSPLADNLGLPFFSFSIKPLPNVFKKVCRYFGVSKNTLAVVGDQIFTDVMGGNLFGAVTIMVEPILNEGTFYFNTKRKMEKPFIKRYYKSGGKRL